MHRDLTDKRVVVTAAGIEIGRAVAAEAAARGVSPRAVRDGYLRQSSLRRFVSAADIANMVLFLCSDAGARISGQALSLDGHTETLAN
ncbi:MAG: SDR family oxidoreductase [Kiloniellaceae bacterium]